MNSSILLIPKKCSCCKNIGRLQQEFETLIKEEKNKNPKLTIQEIQIKIAQDVFHIKKMCCLNNIKGCPCSVIDQYFDIVSLNCKINGIENKNGLKTICEKGMYELPIL